MRSAKRMFALAAVLLFAFSLLVTGCGNAAPGPSAGGTQPEDIVEKLYLNVDVPPCETIRLDEETFEAYAFIPYEEGLTAAAADALVNITAHSVVVIRTESGNGADLAEEILAHADPNKWLCVGAETVNVAYTDHYVVLVMSEKATADAIAENFRVLAKSLDGMDMKLLTTDNSRYER